MTTERSVQHVLMTTDAIGGVWNYSLTLARQLSRRNVRVTLATMGPRPDPHQAAEARRVPGLELVPSTFALEWMDDPWAGVDRAERWLLDLEAARLPDVVHLNGYCHGAARFVAPTIVVAHSCLASRWAAVFASDLPPRYDEYRERVTRGLRAADAIVAPTQAMMRSLERWYAVQRSTVVIENGIEAEHRAAGAKEPFVLAAGRVWDRAKNLTMLADAAPDLPWPLKIAGDASRPDGEGTPHSTGPLLGRLTSDALFQEMERASIFAHPALYEPFGLSPLEAAASKCALVLSDIASLREIWADAAWFVAPDDPIAWRRTLARLTIDPQAIKTLGELGRRRALLFSAARMGSRYLELYESLVASFARSGVRVRVPATFSDRPASATSSVSR